MENFYGYFVKSQCVESIFWKHPSRVHRDVLVENNEGSLYAQIVTSCCSESEPAGVHILELCDGMYWLFYISCLSGGPT